jgi:peptidoglycan/LPS O-acetylase OafA/YrhL
LAADQGVFHFIQNGSAIARTETASRDARLATANGDATIEGDRRWAANPESLPSDQDWRSRIDKRFTSLRGGAALIVMLAHYQYVGFLPGLPAFKYSGQCGLMVFFFLSSFLLCHSLASDPHWAARPHLSLFTYSINRIFRIFPLLCAVIALTYWNGASFFPPSIAYWQALRLSATLGGAPSVLWTIPVELTFYLYLPFVLALTLPATRSRRGAAMLALAYLGWCVAIAVARHEGLPASPWMTLGFHHYANSFVGGVLFYALIANGRIRFSPAAAWVAKIAPLAFLLATPFSQFALIHHDPWMAELAAPGAWQSYYDAVFPFAPLVVGGIVYGLLHPSESLLSRVMRLGFLRKTGELSFGVYLVHMPMIVLIGSRYGFGPLQFCAAIAATFGAAAALSALIERPAIAFGHKLGRWLLAGGSEASPARYPRPATRATPTRSGDGAGCRRSTRLISILSRNWRALSFQVKRRECSRAFSREMVSALRQAALKSSLSTPALGATTSIGPGAGKAATGRPLAIASISTIPNVSVREGKTNTSALA